MLGEKKNGDFILSRLKNLLSYYLITVLYFFFCFEGSITVLYLNSIYLMEKYKGN